MGKLQKTLKTLSLFLKIFERVRNNIYKLYEQNARKYNSGKIYAKYDVGDRVLKKNYVLSNAAHNFSAKLAPKYIPCIIDKVISPLVYLLKDLDGNELGCWHVKDFKMIQLILILMITQTRNMRIRFYSVP